MAFYMDESLKLEVISYEIHPFSIPRRSFSVQVRASFPDEVHGLVPNPERCSRLRPGPRIHLFADHFVPFFTLHPPCREYSSVSAEGCCE